MTTPRRVAESRIERFEMETDEERAERHERERLESSERHERERKEAQERETRDRGDG